MIEEMIQQLIRREGGFVNNPADRGGPTNMGVTQDTLSTWLGHKATIKEVEGLLPSVARDIYYYHYWDATKFASLKVSPVATEMLFDAGVHHGPHRSIRLLQAAIGAKADGVVGPITRSVVNSMPARELAAKLIAARIAYIGRIITKDPSQAEFAAGWAARMAEFVCKLPQVEGL